MNNDNIPLISIILPTYNVASFLLQCLESINAQTYPNYEVVIIIDGATDGSFEIAKEYCERHEKFNVYWQENAGSGPARNAGLSKSSGEFVMFVDPDDWIEKDLLINLVNGQRDGNYDLVATRRISVLCDNKGNVLKKNALFYKDFSLDNQDDVRKSFFDMLKNGVVGSPTQKLYRMSIIRNFKIEFPDLRRSQDVIFNNRYYSCIRNLRLLSYSGYNYRILLENSSGRSAADYYKVIELQYNDYKELYKSWSMCFPDTDFCTFLYEIRIFANLQRCALMGWDIRPIFKNTVINHIVKNASPNSTVKKLVCFLLVKKRFLIVKFLMKKIALFKQLGLKRSK